MSSINSQKANSSMIYCQLALAKLGVNKTRENDGRSNQGEYYIEMHQTENPNVLKIFIVIVVLYFWL